MKRWDQEAEAKNGVWPVVNDRGAQADANSEGNPQEASVRGRTTLIVIIVVLLDMDGATPSSTLLVLSTSLCCFIYLSESTSGITRF